MGSVSFRFTPTRLPCAPSRKASGEFESEVLDDCLRKGKRKPSVNCRENKQSGESPRRWELLNIPFGLDGALIWNPRPKRPSKLDPYKEYIMQRLAEGVDKCAVLLHQAR